MKKRKKKQTRRDIVKYPALDPLYNPKNRSEMIDFDYLNQLNPEELSWLNDFMEEYNGAKLDFKNLKNNLHNTKSLKKDCTDRINARNRCLYTIAKITNKLVVDDEKEREILIDDRYDDYIKFKSDDINLDVTILDDLTDDEVTILNKYIEEYGIDEWDLNYFRDNIKDIVLAIQDYYNQTT